MALWYNLFLKCTGSRKTVELYYFSACLLICLTFMHNPLTLSLSYFQTVCSKNLTESLRPVSSRGRQNTLVMFLPGLVLQRQNEMVT